VSRATGLASSSETLTAYPDADATALDPRRIPTRLAGAPCLPLGRLRPHAARDRETLVARRDLHSPKARADRQCTSHDRGRNSARADTSAPANSRETGQSSAASRTITWKLSSSTPATAASISRVLETIIGTPSTSSNVTPSPPRSSAPRVPCVCTEPQRARHRKARQMRGRRELLRTRPAVRHLRPSRPVTGSAPMAPLSRSLIPGLRRASPPRSSLRVDSQSPFRRPLLDRRAPGFVQYCCNNIVAGNIDGDPTVNGQHPAAQTPT
jgi:hypothetical protein